jgi:hypothetical protein
VRGPLASALQLFVKAKQRRDWVATGMGMRMGRGRDKRDEPWMRGGTACLRGLRRALWRYL